MTSSILALAATSLLALPPFPVQPVKPLGPKVVLPKTIEPDCSATKSVKLPDLRMFGMAPTQGVDYVANLHSKLDVHVDTKPRGIDLVMVLSGSGVGATTPKYRREQHLRWPVTPPPGCEVSHTTAPTASIELPAPVSGQLVRVYGSGLVAEGLCSGDTEYPEKMNKTGCRTLKFDAFTVHFRKKTPSTCGTLTITPPPVDAMKMKKVVSGGASVNSDANYIEVDVEPETVGARTVRLRTRVTIEELGLDHTRVTSDWINSVVFDAAMEAPDCKVVSVEDGSGRLRDRAAFTSSLGYRPRSFDGSAAGSDRRGVVQSAGCRAATGPWTGMGCMVQFNPIRVKLAPK